ncbi:MAG: hypothetical protein PWP65_1506 [Clostridia bacterium]|nr:hypothetical protein [Clostridia bacterium]
MLDVEAYLQEAISAAGPEMRELLQYCLPGGKRLRPLLVILSSNLGYCRPQQVLPVAAAIELIHLASLTHDDILDGAATRRNRPALHRLFGPLPAVLAGDYLFATAFHILARTKKGIMQAVTQAIRLMCEGEIEQQQMPAGDEETYLRRVQKKTAALIATACQCGGILANLTLNQIRSLEQYGLYLGTAFQMVDDILDLSGDPKVTGKPCLQDLQKGIVTLPVLYFLNTSPQKSFWHEMLARRSLGLEEARELARQVRASGSLEASVRTAQQYANQALLALEALPPCPPREKLAELAQKVLAPAAEILTYKLSQPIP